MSDLLRQSGSAWFGSGTSGGTPGGSTTQIQFNSSGAFAGSSRLTWNNTDHTLTVDGTAASSQRLVIKAASGQTAALVNVMDSGGGTFSLISSDGYLCVSGGSGAPGAAINGQGFYLDVSNSHLYIYNPTATRWVNLNGGAVSKSPVVTDENTIYPVNPNVQALIIRAGEPDFDTSLKHFVIRDNADTQDVFVVGQDNNGDMSVTFAGTTNGTTWSVDDANSRATFNKKFVITDTGAFYIYDSGTSTYWKWESISGVWTGTDTGSASLP